MNADLELAKAVLAGEPVALGELDRRLRVQARIAAARIDSNPAFIDEVAQQLAERLLLPREDAPPRLAEFSGSGPLDAFLRVAALRVALNLRGGAVAARSDELDEASLDAAAEGAADVETRLLRAQYQAPFREALREAFAALPREQRQVMRLHYGGGLSGQAIARMMQVDRSTVVRWLASARSALMNETRRRLRDQLKLSPAELTSLIGAMRSQLDLSLSAILQGSQVE